MRKSFLTSMWNVTRQLSKHKTRMYMYQLPFINKKIIAVFNNMQTLKFKAQTDDWVFRCRQS